MKIVLSIRTRPSAMWDSWDAAIQMMEKAGLSVSDNRTKDSLSEDDLIEMVKDVNGMVVGMEKVTARVIDAAPNLVFIGKPGAGVDNIDVEHATSRGVFVCNTAGANANSVADHTFSLILAAMRRILELDKMTRAGEGWIGWPPIIGFELWQKTIGIVGTGAIGKAVARRARGFDMKILAYDKIQDTAFAEECGLQYVTLDELLANSDVVSVHTPLTPETQNIIGKREFEIIKPGAFFINTSRGEVVEEEALIDALKSGRLTAAGLDVFSKEPAENSELFDMSNTVLTPHVAGFSGEYIINTRVQMAAQAIEALKGKIPNNVVNPGAAKVRGL